MANIKHKPTILESITLGSKTAPEIKRAIAMLGDMNDRYNEASGARDKKALRKIANEYAAIGCPRLANEIRAEAKAIRRTRSRTAKRGDRISPAATPRMAVTT